MRKTMGPFRKPGKEPGSDSGREQIRSEERVTMRHTSTLELTDAAPEELAGGESEQQGVWSSLSDWKVGATRS